LNRLPFAHSASALKIQLNPTQMAIFTGTFLSGPTHHSSLCVLHMTAGRAVSTVIQIGNEWEVHAFHFNALQLLLGLYLLYSKKALEMTLS